MQRERPAGRYGGEVRQPCKYAPYTPGKRVKAASGFVCISSLHYVRCLLFNFRSVHLLIECKLLLPGKGSGFKSVASALIQARADSADSSASDSKASQSRLYGGTASSEAKQKEMILRAQKKAPTEDGMLRISPEDLANMQAEIAKLRETVQKLQPLDPENAQLKRTVQSLQ